MATPHARLAAGALMLLAAACQRADAGQPGPGVELPEPEDLYYGIYLKGAKVGWMRSQVRLGGGRVELDTALTAQVAGMGQVASVELHELLFGIVDCKAGARIFVARLADRADVHQRLTVRIDPDFLIHRIRHWNGVEKGERNVGVSVKEDRLVEALE